MKTISEELKQKLLLAKTAEEVFELSKAEYPEITMKEAEQLFDRITSKNKEMSDEELSTVAGGMKQEDSQGKYHFFNPVSKYDAVVGEEYYIVEDSYWFYPDWYHGRLDKSYEKSKFIGTERTHAFYVDMEMGEKKYYYKEFSGDDYNLFKSMDYLWED